MKEKSVKLSFNLNIPQFWEVRKGRAAILDSTLFVWCYKSDSFVLFRRHITSNLRLKLAP